MRSGFGIGGCQKGVADRDPDLVAVLPREISFVLEMWLVMHEDMRNVRRVRLLYDHLADALGGYGVRKAQAQGRVSADGKPGKIRSAKGATWG